MTLQHSPGPWRYDSDAYRIMRESDEYHVVAGFDDRDLPTEADGRLMAAAPDMLRLLRVLVPMSESGAEDREGWMVWNAALNEASELIARLDGDT